MKKCEEQPFDLEATLQIIDVATDKMEKQRMRLEEIGKRLAELDPDALDQILRDAS